jgi:hypothetical protein
MSWLPEVFLDDGSRKTGDEGDAVAWVNNVTTTLEVGNDHQADNGKRWACQDP